MTLTLTYEDSDNVYTLDFIKFAKKLGITEEQIKAVIMQELSK